MNLGQRNKPSSAVVTERGEGGSLDLEAAYTCPRAPARHSEAPSQPPEYWAFIRIV